MASLDGVDIICDPSQVGIIVNTSMIDPSLDIDNLRVGTNDDIECLPGIDMRHVELEVFTFKHNQCEPELANVSLTKKYAIII